MGMLFEIGSASIELVREFFANLGEHGEGYFETWSRGRAIRVDIDLISTITHTPRVLESVYPWPLNDMPPRSSLVECFADRKPHNMNVEGVGGFKLNDLPVDYRMASGWS